MNLAGTVNSNQKEGKFLILSTANEHTALLYNAQFHFYKITSLQKRTSGCVICA